MLSIQLFLIMYDPRAVDTYDPARLKGNINNPKEAARQEACEKKGHNKTRHILEPSHADGKKRTSSYVTLTKGGYNGS